MREYRQASGKYSFLAVGIFGDARSQPAALFQIDRCLDVQAIKPVASGIVWWRNAFDGRCLPINHDFQSSKRKNGPGRRSDFHPALAAKLHPFTRRLTVYLEG